MIGKFNSLKAETRLPWKNFFETQKHALAFFSLRFRSLEKWPSELAETYEIRLPAVEKNMQSQQCYGPSILILMNLLRRTRRVPGAIAECGVFRGASLVPLAHYARQMGLSKPVLGLDSFCGFGAEVQADIDLGGVPTGSKRVGGFGETSREIVEQKLTAFGLQQRVRLMEGAFRETLEGLSETRFSFVHLDCDLYESYRLCLEFFYPRMSPGGILLLDEYLEPRWPGCQKAVDAFLADKPEKPQMIREGCFHRYFIAKQAGRRN